MDTNKIINELPKLFDRATKDFELWNKKLFEANDTRWRLETFPEELKKFRNSFEYHIGKKYIRISYIPHPNGDMSSYDRAFCFINISNPKFKFGDLLQSAVTTPALNFARGNIFDLSKSRIDWTGYIEKIK
tara:strand:+ start:85 stop:477 length:393 start_codon:yes stop_codon:yes gene_type:complete